MLLDHLNQIFNLIDQCLSTSSKKKKIYRMHQLTELYFSHTQDGLSQQIEVSFRFTERIVTNVEERSDECQDPNYFTFRNPFLDFYLLK